MNRKKMEKRFVKKRKKLYLSKFSAEFEKALLDYMPISNDPIIISIISKSITNMLLEIKE